MSTVESMKRRRLVKWHTATITDFAKPVKLNREFVNQCIEGIPRHIARRLIDGYAHRYASQTAANPQRSANIYIREVSKPIRALLDNCPFDNLKALRRDHVLEQTAKDAAEHCQNIIRDYASGEKPDYETAISEVYSDLSRFVRLWGMEPPLNVAEPDTEQQEAAICRMTAESWWLRRLSRIRDQINEQIAILAGLVRKGCQPYASNQAVYEWQQQQAKNAAYLEMMDLVDQETGETFNLAEIAAATTANPEKRRIELMVRIRGLENLADDFGYQSFFVTWTAPSKYHPSSRKYNGCTPSETQKYLCSQWAKARAAIKRSELRWFGVRVAEPHADACPHWHLLFFIHPADMAAMKQILTGYALEHDPDEKGAKKNRIDFEEIDRSKGSATGYIAKYISKNINANHLDNQPDFETGNSSLTDAVQRVTAWASRWNIRQFQFFGAAAVSVWRECRRLKDPSEKAAFEQIRKAADSAKWDEFTKLITENPVKLAYDNEAKNDYGETVKKIIGLFFGAEHISTRERVFKLERRQPQSRDSGDSWSPVNNCTQYDDSITSAAQNAGLDPALIRALKMGAGVIDENRGFKVIDRELRVFE